MKLLKPGWVAQVGFRNEEWPYPSTYAIKTWKTLSLWLSLKSLIYNLIQDDHPIFSIDIHPAGGKFATGGQGDDCGRWIRLKPGINFKDAVLTFFCLQGHSLELSTYPQS